MVPDELVRAAHEAGDGVFTWRLQQADELRTQFDSASYTFDENPTLLVMRAVMFGC